MWQRPLNRKLFITSALLLGMLGLWQSDYDDNIQQLQSLPAALKQQEKDIQAISGMGSSQPMLIIRGNSEQSVLEQMYQLSPDLQTLKQTGAISNYQNLADFVPPQSVQIENFQLVKALYDSQSQPLSNAIGLTQIPTLSPELIPFTLNHFLSSAAGRDLKPLWLDNIDGQYAALILLQEVSNPAKVKALAEQHNGVSWLNKTEEVSQLFGQYRQRISVLIGVACSLIFVILSIRFGPRTAFSILIAPVLATGIGLTAGALSSVPMNLFNLLALFLVIGIGIDYSLFYVEQHDSLRAWLTNTLAAATTLLAFGLLSLSNTEAIHSFGITVLVGITAAWFLSPIAIRNKLNC